MGGAKYEQAVIVRLTGGSGNDGRDGDAKSELARVVSRKNSAMQRCYATWAQAEGPRATRLRVKATLTVSTDGTISAVKVAGAPPTLSECMTTKLLAIRGLPALPSPQDFAQAYVFELPAAPAPTKSAK